MKILHIISGLDTGGAEGMLSRLIVQLGHHQQLVVSLTGIGGAATTIIHSGVPVRAFDMRGARFLVSFPRLCCFIIANKPDIVQTWLYHADLLGGIAARVCRVRNVFWNIRNTEIPQGRFSITGAVIRVAAFMSRYIPRKIICCAHASLTKHAQLGYDLSKLVMIPNGYDLDRFTGRELARGNVRRELDISEDKLVIGVAGRYDPLKGYDVFVKVAGMLDSALPGRLVFLAAGRNVSSTNLELMALIERFAPTATFKLMGERCDLPDVLRAMDVFCLSSRAEGFPNVVAEAMLSGLLCVVTDVGDSRVIVGSAGFVVNAEDPSVLALALEKAARLSADERVTFGRLARARIRETYDIRRIGKLYESIYYDSTKLR